MRRTRIFLTLSVLLLVLSAAGCGKEAPKEPPQLTIVCTAGEYRVLRGGFTWDVMKRGSEVGSGVIACGSDPLTWDFEPVPLWERETVRFAFPDGMEPDSLLTGSFYRVKDGEIDKDNPLGVSIRKYSGGQAGEEGLYGYFDAIYGTEGVYVLRAQWNRPRWRGDCTYAFAVTGID